MTLFRKKVVIVKEEEKLKDIKALERDVQRTIVGQNIAVRQITTALYRAKNFKTIRTNLMIVGNEVAAKKIML